MNLANHKYVHKGIHFIKRVKKARVGNEPFRLTANRLGLPCIDFLMTLLALLIFLYCTNTGILGMIGLETLSLAKTRNLPKAEI
jgi:hypothetical protein